MIIKLEPGQKVNLTIRKVDVVEGNYGKQYKFSGSTADDSDSVLFLNLDTAERQLARAGYSSVAEVLDQTVEIEKVERQGKNYTNINRPSGSVPAPRATSSVKQPFTSGPHIPGMDGPKPIATPEYGDVPAQQKAVDAIKDQSTERLNRLFTLYRTCFIEAVSVAKGLPNATPEAIAAMTATIFIAAKERAA